MTTLRQLQCLVAIADTGRYGEAAARLRVSQSAISAQISALESRLGVILLERGRHGARLTPAGDAVLSKARTVLALVSDLEAGAARQAEALGGLVRLGALSTLGPYLLPRALPGLHAAYPELRLFVREGPSEDLERLVIEGALDAALSDAPVTPSGLFSDILFSEQLFAVMPADDLLSARDVLKPADLAGRDLLTLGARYRLGRKTAELAEAASASVRFDYEGTSLDALRQMAATGLGVAIVTELYVRSEIDGRNDVAAAPLSGARWNRPVHLIWRSDSRRVEDYRRIGAALKAAFSTP